MLYDLISFNIIYNVCDCYMHNVCYFPRWIIIEVNRSSELLEHESCNRPGAVTCLRPSTVNMFILFNFKGNTLVNITRFIAIIHKRPKWKNTRSSVQIWFILLITKFSVSRVTSILVSLYDIVSLYNLYIMYDSCTTIRFWINYLLSLKKNNYKLFTITTFKVEDI